MHEMSAEPWECTASRRRPNSPAIGADHTLIANTLKGKEVTKWYACILSRKKATLFGDVALVSFLEMDDMFVYACILNKLPRDAPQYVGTIRDMLKKCRRAYLAAHVSTELLHSNTIMQNFRLHASILILLCHYYYATAVVDIDRLLF